MTSKDPRVEKGKEATSKEEEVDDTYKGGETRVRGVGSDLSFLKLVKLVKEVVGVNSHNEIELHALLSHATGVLCAVIKDDEDVVSILRDERAVVVFVTVKAGNANNIPHEHARCTYEVSANDVCTISIEMCIEQNTRYFATNTIVARKCIGSVVISKQHCDGYDYVGGHEDRSEDDRVEQTDIPYCNHVDSGRGHTTTVVLEEVELDDHCRTVKLEDVEGDLIYENTIALENGIRSPDDSDEERVNIGVSHQWIILGLDMISFQTVGSEESRSMDDHLYRGKVFLSKAELKRALSMLALKEHFEFRVKKSCHVRFEVGCKDKACKFALRATKLPEGEYWQVRTLHKMNRKWGLQCLYGKAWQGKEYAKSLVFGPQEESFQIVPSYFHMLERENFDIVTCVTIDGEQRFKYCFWAFGSCIRGFSAVIRPIVAINATYMKGRFKGILFVAVCKDANEQIYPLAFGIGHVEDEESWSWFLNQLRRVIGCPENAMFISDKHFGIKNAVEKVYKDAHHDLCNYHLGKNVKNRFKCEDVAAIFTMAANCYRVSDFDRHMNQLK
ncbi:Transposase [Theobroma cacao]|nr:Transposase [Theobroma cacao]